MQSPGIVHAYLALSFLCAFINLPPTASHVVQGRSGLACFGIWVVTLNSLNFINGIVWRNDAIDRAPVFCDISTRITLVGPLGLLVSNWCIIRYLAVIVTPNRPMESATELKKRTILDYTLSFGFPLTVAAGSVVYQTARYQVVGTIGCASVYLLTWPTFIMLLIWPVIFCGADCAYSLYVMYWLVRQHRNVRQMIKNSDVHVSRFVRMSALAATYLCISAPYTIYGILENIVEVGPYVPWTSWSLLHGRSNSLSSVRQNPIYNITFSDWYFVIAGLAVFFFFSFGNEYVAIYKRCTQALRVNHRQKKTNKDGNNLHPCGIPANVPQSNDLRGLGYGSGSDPCNAGDQVDDSRRPAVLDSPPVMPYSRCVHVSIMKEKEVLHHDV